MEKEPAKSCRENPHESGICRLRDGGPILLRRHCSHGRERDTTTLNRRREPITPERTGAPLHLPRFLCIEGELRSTRRRRSDRIIRELTSTTTSSPPTCATTCAACATRYA